MNKRLLVCILLFASTASCSSPARVEDIAIPKAPVEPMSTIAPPTPTPEPTPLPGRLVLPVESLADEFPWLGEYTGGEYPATFFVGFNTRQAPFDSSLVRQALAMAIDRQALLELVQHLGRNRANANTYALATTFTPPEILGRDLTNDVGTQFDPELARARLSEAGYEDVSAFPSFEFRVNFSGDIAPGAGKQIAQKILDMWEENLGLTSGRVRLVDSGYIDGLISDPAEVFILGWGPDYYDPDNFLRDAFFTETEDFSYYNMTGFADESYKELVDTARSLSNAFERQLLYIQAEQLLCEEYLPLIPIYRVTLSDR